MFPQVVTLGKFLPSSLSPFAHIHDLWVCFQDFGLLPTLLSYIRLASLFNTVDAYRHVYFPWGKRSNKQSVGWGGEKKKGEGQRGKKNDPMQFLGPFYPWLWPLCLFISLGTTCHVLLCAPNFFFSSGWPGIIPNNSDWLWLPGNNKTLHGKEKPPRFEVLDRIFCQPHFFKVTFHFRKSIKNLRYWRVWSRSLHVSKLPWGSFREEVES